MVVATIVGAGPAGSIAGEVLSKQGIETRLIDGDVFPGEKKPCGGMLRINGAKTFGMPWRLASRQIRGIRVVFPNRKVQEVAYRHVIALNYDRGVLGHYLVERVKGSGGDVVAGVKVVDVIRCRDNWKTAAYELTCRSPDGKVRRFTTDLLVAADGVNSVVVEKTGVRQQFRPNQLGLCVQYQIELENSIIDRRIGDRNEMYYGRDVAPFGYAWIFPKRNSVTVGVGSLLSAVKSNLREYLEHFVKRHPVASEKLAGGRAIRFDTALCPLSGLVSPTYGDHLVLAGDAAGHCSPISGEGIYYSMVGGKIAGEILSTAIDEGDLSAKYLKKYQHAWRKAFGSDLRVGRWLQRIANRSGFMSGTFRRETPFSLRLSERVADILAGVKPYKNSLLGAIPEFVMAKAMEWLRGD